jgi:multiple sugar transport system permease protein
LISTLRIFSQVYIMTSGGPASSSSSVLFYIYTVATRNQKFGLAAAVSMLLFAVILVVTLAGRRIVREA